jgi:hypothetical protein
MAGPVQNLLLQFSVNGQNLPWAPYFQSFEMRKSITDTADLATLTFLGMDQESIAKAALQANQNLTFTWANGSNTSIPHNYVIHAVDIQYIGDRAWTKINLVDNRVNLMSNSAFTGYPNMSFSQIVSQVASSYSNLAAPVVVADKFLTNVLQTGATHWSFLSALKREGTRAASTGASDYRLYFRGGNELHFHPPDYSQSPYRSITLFGGSTPSQVNLRLAPWKPIIGGSPGYKVSTFLRDEVRPFTASSNQSTAFQGEPSLGNLETPQAPVASNAVGAFLGRFFRSAHSLSTLIDRDAELGAEEAFGDGSFLELTLEGDPGMEPGSIISLKYLDRYSGQPMEANGNWLVEEVYHEILGNVKGKTKIKVSRMANNSIGSQTIPGLQSNTNTTPSNTSGTTLTSSGTTGG